MSDIKENISINEFVEDLSSAVLERLPKTERENITVTVQEIRKNNGVILHGLIIRDSSKDLSPTIYVEKFYEQFMNGTGINECASEILEVYTQSMKSVLTCPVDFIMNYEHTADYIFPKLVNAGKNQELLDDLPHAGFGDLAVIFLIRLENMIAEGVGTVVINNQMAENWGKSTEELLNVALNNMRRNNDVSIRNIFSVLSELIPRTNTEDLDTDMIRDCFEEESSPKMYVMTNSQRINGAVSMVDSDSLSEFADSIDSDLYIIPSSIHELILVPHLNTENRANDLAAMVREVNATQVAGEDFLSDNVYEFSRKSRSVCNALTGERLELKVS